MTGAVNAVTCAVTAVTWGCDPALDVTGTVPAVIAVAGCRQLAQSPDQQPETRCIAVGRVAGHVPRANRGRVSVPKYPKADTLVPRFFTLYPRSRSPRAPTPSLSRTGAGLAAHTAASSARESAASVYSRSRREACWRSRPRRPPSVNVRRSRGVGGA